MIFSKHNQMVMLSKHEFVAKLAQNNRRIIKKGGDAMEAFLTFFDSTIIPLITANSLELRYYSKEKNYHGVSMNHIREVQKPVVIHRCKGLRET